MGAVNYGFFFFLLSKILSVNCLPNNPSNSIPFHGQNAPAASNSWTGQPILQGITNVFDAMNPNPSQNTYLNNNDNQQNIKYDQQYSPLQPYNSLHYNNYNQQYSMSQLYNAQPHNSHNYEQQSTVPQQYNEQPYNYKQQSSVPQPYNAPPYNYEEQSSVIQPYNAPQVIQKNQNQHSKEPQLYNLHPPSQSSGQKNTQSFGTIVPSQKEYQKQMPSSINQPIEILPAFGQPINNAQNQENIPQSSPPIPPNPNQSQLSKPIIKESSKSNKYNIDIKEAELPDFGQPNNNVKNQNIIQKSSPPILPNPNQSQLSKPIIKESSKSNKYNIDIKEAELPDFGQPNNNVKNQNIIQKSSPPILPNPNQSQLSKPIIKESSKSNKYNIDIKEAELPDFGQPNNNVKNQNIIQKSSPPIPPNPNQSQLSKPIIKESSKSNKYNIDIKEAELPDFGQPNNNVKNQNIIQKSSPPILPNPNQSQLSKPIIKESSKSNKYNIDIKEAELPDFGQPNNNVKNQNIIQKSSPPIPPNPNQSQLSKPIIKESSKSNKYNIDIKEAELPDFGQPNNNVKNQNIIQKSSPPILPNPNQSQLSKPIIKESSKSNKYNIDIKEAELPDFGQPNNNVKNQNIIQKSSPPIPPNPNQSQLSKPIIKESSKSNKYNIDIKEAELPDFGQPNNNVKNQNIIQKSSPPIPPNPNQSQLSKPIVKESSKSNEYNIDTKEAELPDFGQPNYNAKNQENIQQSSPPISSIPNQFQLSKPIVKETFTPNGYDIEIKEEVPYFGQPISNVKNQENIQQSSPPNEYDTEIKEEVPDFDQVIYNAENQENKPSLPSSAPSIPNQFQLSKPIVQGPSTSNGYNVDNKEAEVPYFGQPISNVKNQENIQQSSPPNEYDTEIKEEVPDFDQVIYNAENQGNKPSLPSSAPSIPNQFQLSKPIVQGPSTSNEYNVDNKEAEVPYFDQPISNVKNQENIQQSYPPNEYDTEIKEEVPDFDQVIYNAENEGNKPSLPSSAPSIPNQFQLSKPIVQGPSTSNGYNVDNKEAEVPYFGQPISNVKNQENIQQSSPPNEYGTEIKEEVPDFDQVIYNAENQGNKPSLPSSAPSIPNQFQLSKPIVQDPSTSNGYNVDNKEADVPYFGQPISNVKNQENVQQSSPPNEYDTEIKEDETDFNQVIYNAESQGNKPSSAPYFPSNQSKISQIPSQSSSKLTPNENTMQITNDNMPLNSLLGLPDGQSEPLINDFAQNEDVLIDNSQTDIQSFLNSENNNIPNPSNNVLESQDDSQLVFNDLPPQLPMNMQAANVIIDSQSNDLINNIDLNDDTENLQNTLNEDSLPTNSEGTELNEESKLKNAMSESPVVALDDTDIDNDKLYSLENLTFDAPPPELDGLSKYYTSFIVDTENPKNAKEDNAKITVYANPNDVHILQLSPKQPSTNDNSYLINNNLLKTPLTGMPLWYSSFPNGADYVQNFNSNTNKQLSNSLFNFNQNPAYNQIPMYLENSNYFNQQAAVDQNQMTSNIQSHGLSLDDNQPSSMDNSGSIYKKVDLKNPPPNNSNSWSLLKKDYTKNLRPNQNDRYTSDDGTTRSSFFGTPLSSYQNSDQGILNLLSNDMFVQNMISVISNSVQAPLDGTKAIFDVTRANFPRSSVNHIICLTHAIVRSVMLNLRQTLNTFMKTLYGHRVKRDFNPFEALYNLPGTLVNKYSLQSSTAPTTKNINSPYYNQPTTTGQQPTADYSMSQSATENMLGRQQTYGNEIDKNYYGSQDNIIGVVPQPASTQNYVLNSLIDAITSAVRSNVPAPYSIDSPEVKQYTQQVIVTAEIVFKNQIDNILHGQSPTLNMY